MTRSTIHHIRRAGRPDGILTAISISTGCAISPDKPATAFAHEEAALEPQCVRLVALKGTHARSQKRPQLPLVYLVSLADMCT